MVFYVAARRKCVAKEKTTILDLPKELLGDIITMDSLPRHDILSTRLAHPYLTPTCSEVLKQHLKTLYLHPSPRALKAALEICEQPVFSQGIEEVTLLGRVDWVQIRSPDYYSTSATDPTNGWDNMDTRRDFCAWPATLPGLSESMPTSDTFVTHLRKINVSSSQGRQFPTPTLANEKGTASAWPLSATLNEAYRPLFHALGALPKLRNMSFAEAVTKPGFNEVTQSTILATARKAMVKGAGSAGLPVRNSPRPWADAHIMLGLLNHPEMHIRGLCLTTELPYAWAFIPMVSSQATLFPPVSLLEAFDRLRSLELHLDQGWTATKWQKFCTHGLKHSTELERICLAWKSNPTVKTARCEISLMLLLERRTWSALRSFEVTFDSPANSRPICQRFDLVDFLERHKATLKHLVLSGVVIANFGCRFDAPEGNADAILDQSAHDTTRDILASLVKMPSIYEVSFSFMRYYHDGRCRHCDTSPGVFPWRDCKLECGLYCRSHLPQVPVSMVEDFEGLTLDLGVELKEGNEWDFGLWVIRGRLEAAVVEG